MSQSNHSFPGRLGLRPRPTRTSITPTVFFAWVLLSGCSNERVTVEHPEVRFSTDSLPTYSLEGQVFSTSDSLGRPSRIAVGSKYLIIGDPRNPLQIQIFDRESGELVTSAGTSGEGPEELGYLSAFDFKPGSDSGWIYDYQPRTLHFVDLDSLVQTRALTGPRVQLRGGSIPVWPVWIAGDSIACAGFYKSGKLAIYASDGSLSRYLGPDPPGLATSPVPVRQHAYLSLLRTNSNGTRIATAAQYTDRFEIYDRQGLRHLVRGPEFHEPVYEVYSNEEGVAWLGFEDDSREGYVGLTVTDELIFALYSGMTNEALLRQRWFAAPAHTVVVFDWEGQPIAVLELKEGASNIAVSDDGRSLYAIYHRPIPMILLYSVPDLLGTTA